MRARVLEGHPLDLRRRHHAPVLGVEHEYRVYDGDQQVDFERLLPSLRVDGLRIDPTDPNAYRTAWGGIVTADGREAEIATPPVLLRPGCTSELEWRTAAAHESLLALLPHELRLDGYSTHLNVEVDDDEVVAAGRLFVRHFAPSMMLLLDRPSSPGLLVRPRCGRLELGGEYINGAHLRAAATFAAAASLTCVSAMRSSATRPHLPTRVRTRVRPSNIRAGWYVDRRAFGPDLYVHGRRTPLQAGHRRLWLAQDHLVDAWTSARPAIEPVLDTAELSLVDEVVDGRRALPLECDLSVVDAPGSFEDDAFARAVHTRTRPGFVVEPAAIAWHAVAFRLRGRRDGIACIPRADLDEFLHALDAGDVDETIHRFLASPPQGRVLRDSMQTSRPGLFDELASPGAVAPPERLPGRPRLHGRGGGTPRDSRRDKRRRRGPRRLLVAAGALAVIAVALVVLLTRDDSSSTVTSTGLGGAPIGAVPVRYNVEFTVASVNVGPHYSGEPVPTLGSRVTVPVLATCAETCSFGDAGGATGSLPFVDLGLPLTATSPDLLKASTDSSDSSSPCPQVSAVHELVTVRVTRDGAGKVTGFTGRDELTHPGGVEETTASGTCSTFDITYTFVGTPA